MTNNILRILKKSLLISLGTVALSVGVAQTAKADVLTFDDVTNLDTDYIPSEYGGLYWSGFTLVSKDVAPVFEKGTVSGKYAAYTTSPHRGVISTGDYNKFFDFNSAFLTSTFSDNNYVTVEGMLFGQVSKYSKTVLVNRNAPTKFDFNFLGINYLRFSSSNSQTMDNFTFNERVTPPNPTSVPEPGLLAGLFVITPSAAAWLKRKQLKQAVQ